MFKKQKIPTTERLALEFEKAGAPEFMIRAARAGQYDDYKSNLDFPIRKLVSDCCLLGMRDIAERAMNGEFDGQKWEAEEWEASPEGQRAIRDLKGGK